MRGAADRSKGSGGRGWVLPAVAGGIYALVVLVIVFNRAASSSDFRDFWENAVHFRETGVISSELGVHNYLPFFTIFMLPWGFMPLQGAIVVFTVLSLGLFAVSAVLVADLLNDGVLRRPRGAALLAVGLALVYVHSCAVLGNVGLLLVFLIVAGWFLTERGREWEAGAALGLAVLIKLLPVVLLVFFLLKRRWRVLGGAVVVMVVLGIGLPLATLGYEETVAQHKAFYKRAASGHSAIQTITADRPTKANFSNNAAPMVLRRLLSPIDGGKTSSGPLYVNFADLPRGTILAIYVILMAVFVGLTSLATVRHSRSWPPVNVEEGRALRAQFGLWCCIMLLAAPLVWTHYLPLLFWPLALVADDVCRSRRGGGPVRKSSVAALVIWLICAGLLAWPTARAAGAQIVSVGCLWVGVLILARPGLKSHSQAP